MQVCSNNVRMDIESIEPWEAHETVQKRVDQTLAIPEHVKAIIDAGHHAGLNKMGV